MNVINMRLTESQLRRIVRRLIQERTGLAVSGSPEITAHGDSPEMEAIRAALGDNEYMPEEVRHLVYSLRLERPEHIMIRDNVIHGGLGDVHIDLAGARSAGTTLYNIADALEHLGARRTAS